LVVDTSNHLAYFELKLRFSVELVRDRRFTAARRALVHAREVLDRTSQEWEDGYSRELADEGAALLRAGWQEEFAAKTAGARRTELLQELEEESRSE
jgi:hypothetical protein